MAGEHRAKRGDQLTQHKTVDRVHGYAAAGARAGRGFDPSLDFLLRAHGESNGQHFAADERQSFALFNDFRESNARLSASGTCDHKSIRVGLDRFDLVSV